MIWFVLVVLVVAVGVALWRMAAWSKDVDEDLKYMNEGRGPGAGIFGIFRRNRSL